MRSAFTKIFWGFLIVFLDIRFFMPVDVLADPIGYYVIFSGINMVLNDFPIARKAKYLSIALAVLSIPTFFTQLEGTEPIQANDYIDWYMTGLGLAHVVLIFYIFQLIVEIAKRSGNEAFIRRSNKTFITYFVVTFIVYLWSSFAMNLPMNLDWVLILTTLLLIIGFIMGIVFLALIWSTTKIRIEPME